MGMGIDGCLVKQCNTLIIIQLDGALDDAPTDEMIRMFKQADKIGERTLCRESLKELDCVN